MSDIMPVMQGFQTAQIQAWRIECDECILAKQPYAAIVVSGPRASHTALEWAQEHYRKVHHKPVIGDWRST